jgi:hypothetical protein
MKIEMNPTAKILFGTVLIVLCLFVADEISEHAEHGDLPFVCLVTPVTALLALFSLGMICKQIGVFFRKKPS